MDRKIEELEKKVKFLQVTIDKIKKWIWLKYEDQIPQEILEYDQNFDDILVTTNTTCQLEGNKVGQIDIKEEINEEIILPDLSDDDEMDHFFEPPLSRTSQIEILPFDYPPPASPIGLSNDKNEPNPLPINNISGPNSKYPLIRLKRLELPIRKPYSAISIRSKDRLEGNPKIINRRKVLRGKNRTRGKRNKICDSMKKACKKCGKLIKETYMKQHMTLHMGKEKWRHVCHIGGCIKRFPVRTALLEHYSVHMNPYRDEYSEEFTKNCPENILKYIENRKKSLKKYWRTKGGEQYKVKILNGQIGGALKEACTVCGKTMTRKHLKKHMQIHTGTLKLRFACTVENCPRKFSTICELNKHCLIHLNPKGKEYSEGFSKKCPEEVLKYLEKKNEKKNAKSVDCPTCGSSMSKRSLTTHIKSIHNGNLDESWNFPCEVVNCNLKFPLKTALWTHYGAHLNPRNKTFSLEFKEKCPDVVLKFLENKEKKNIVKAKKACSICGKEVTMMARHKRLVHDAENKRFSCEICLWKFPIKDNLWAHYSVHVNPRSKSYSEEFAKKCTQEILQYIKKRKISNKKYNRANRISRKEKAN